MLSFFWYGSLLPFRGKGDFFDNGKSKNILFQIKNRLETKLIELKKIKKKLPRQKKTALKIQFYLKVIEVQNFHKTGLKYPSGFLVLIIFINFHYY